MYCRCIMTSAAALLLAATFAPPESQARGAIPAGKATQGAAGQNPGATKNKANKLHQTPEGAFRAFMAAGEKEDWKGLCECLTDDTRDRFATGLIFTGGLARAFADTAEQRAQIKPVDDVLLKYGINTDIEPRKGLKSLIQDGKDIQKAVRKAVESIKDRNAFIAEVLAAFQQALPGYTKNILAEQFFDFNDVTLEEVKVQGNSATAVVVARREGQEARQPLNFRRIDGG